MNIDRTFIEAELSSLAQNREQAKRMLDQIAGAEAAYAAVLKRMDEPAPEPTPKKKAAAKPAARKKEA